VSSFQSSIWQGVLECFDPGFLGAAKEVRHPFLDLRVLIFLLSVPPVPWAREKLLERKSMRGVLPATITNRPKTPLRADPYLKGLVKLDQGLSTETIRLLTFRIWLCQHDGLEGEPWILNPIRM
jgi:hypothetical protein